jgi:hypothetical protein
VVGRSMASIRISPFGRRGKMAIRPFTPFPPPPLKFRTVGFPQYGFKQAVRGALRHLPMALTLPQWLFRRRTFCSVVGLASGGMRASVSTHLPSGPWLRRFFIVRWPHRLLWPHPSFCPLPPVSFFMPTAPQLTEVPQFTPPRLDSVPSPLLRWFPSADNESRAGLGLHPF